MHALLRLRNLCWLAIPLLLIACSNGRGSVEQQAEEAQETFTVGGTVTGLAGSGLVLQNNGGGDLAIANNGAFTFTGRLADGASYSVTVLSPPTAPLQTCSVANGSGAIAAANVANI